LTEENIGNQVNGDTPWTFYHKELNIPAGTEFFDIRLNSHIPDYGVAWSWFDNVGIIEWTDWQDTEIPLQIIAPNDFYFSQFKTEQNINEVLITYNERTFNAPQFSTDTSHYANSKSGELKQNYPNPFKSDGIGTRISFNLKRPAKVEVTIYNIRGQKVKTLTNENYPAGKYNLAWNGTNETDKLVASGVYFYKLSVGDEICEVKKCLLMR